MPNCNAKGPKYQIVDGLRFPPDFPPQKIKSALKYKAKDDDLFLAAFPKSGSTWTKQICTLILSSGEVTSELKEKGLFYVSPVLELFGSEKIEEMPNPKVIKTHLPHEITPYNSKAKYIYVARNPKDVLVSLYHHLKLVSHFEFTGTIHDLLPFFVKGDLSCCSYVHHMLSWWKHRHDSNMLFLLYEDMKTNIREAVCRIAAFMGDDYKKKLERNPEILDKIINHSDISFMKQTTNKDLERIYGEMGILNHSHDFNFVRKGIIGDWKNELTAEDNKTIEKWFEDSFKNTGIYNLWDKYDVFDHKF